MADEKRPERQSFTRAEAIAFGNYLLSDERKALIKQSGNGRFKEVQHSDLENFEDIILKSEKDVVV